LKPSKNHLTILLSITNDPCNLNSFWIMRGWNRACARHSRSLTGEQGVAYTQFRTAPAETVSLLGVRRRKGSKAEVLLLALPLLNSQSTRVGFNAHHSQRHLGRSSLDSERNGPSVDCNQEIFDHKN
jgi:hypothetical protein